MVDADLFDPEILEALRSIKSLDVKKTLDCGFNPWTHDQTLVEATEPQRRLLVTGNFRNINEKRYPPCGHGGIILINHPSPTGRVVGERMRAFARAGGRSHAKGHVTYLNRDKAVVHKLYKEITEVRF
jgi:hypothetical protein